MLKTKNVDWGFFGTCKSNYGLNDSDASKIFAHAVKELGSTEMARDYLDSRSGRHFSDALSFHSPIKPTLAELKLAVAECLKLDSWKNDFKDFASEWEGLKK